MCIRVCVCVRSRSARVLGGAVGEIASREGQCPPKEILKEI